MAEQVQAEHAVPALGERLRERPVDPPREEQRRQQQHRPVAAPVLVVDEPVAVEAKLARPTLRHRTEDIPLD